MIFFLVVLVVLIIFVLIDRMFGDVLVVSFGYLLIDEVG